MNKNADKDYFLFEIGNTFKLSSTALLKKKNQYPEHTRTDTPRSLKGPYPFLLGS